MDKIEIYYTSKDKYEIKNAHRIPLNVFNDMNLILILI